MDLRLEDVTLEYPEAVALRGVSASFPPRSWTLVLGRAGSGKTSLLKVLAGLKAPARGQALWSGADVAALSRPERRARQSSFGMVFQTDALFDSLSVLQNVELPLLRRRLPRPEASARAREALEAVGLGHALDALPERLSGGMRKRAGLARALVARPEVLLADDPLAGLDPLTARQVCALLERSARDRSLVVAAPEPLPLPFPRWLVLERGRVLHDGPPAEELLDRQEGVGSA